MEEWKEYKLGDLYEVHNGLSKGGNFFGSGYPFLSFSTVFKNFFLPHSLDSLVQTSEKERSNFDIKRGDVFITRTSETAEELGMSSVALKDYPDATYNGFTKRLRPINGENVAIPEYIGYYLRSPKFRSLFYGLSSSMSTRASLANGDLLNMKVYLPSLKVQKRIASILKSLDDKIENNRKINENLEQQAQALFKSWFVDFEPFRDQPFVESELGMIPEGWRVYSLPEIVNVYSGYSYKGSELKESKNAMATIKNFDRSGGFKVDGYKEIELSDRIKTTQYANLFDVIVAHTDLTQNAEIIGNPALILNKNGYDKIIISMDLCKVVPKTSFIPNTLLYCILNDSRFKQHALGYVNGTTVLHLNKKALPDYKIALPCDLSNLFTITKAIDPLFRAESNNIIESSRLSQLRDTLLPRLMSGELSVK